MADRFDDAKRSLEGVPAPDMWSEAQRRAEGGAVVPLAPVARRVRRPARWLTAAAAAVIVVAGTVAVLAADDDEPLDTGPSASEDPAEDLEGRLTVYQADGACKLGIRGEPLPEPVTVSQVEGFEAGGIGVGTHLSGQLDTTQSYEVQVPGQMVIDLVGERTEDIQVGDEAAVLWFQADALQVRVFRGSEEPCDSFTVTVGGGTEEENRQAAVEIAERVVLPSELPQTDPQPADENPLAGTEWFLERSVLAGDSTDSVEGLLFTFTDAEASWTDGCNSFSGPYTFYGEWLELGTERLQTTVGCEATATIEAVDAVMQRTVAVTIDGDVLELRSGQGQLVLRPAGRTVEVPPAETTTSAPSQVQLSEDLAGLWEITELRQGATIVPLPQGELLAEFSWEQVSWNDGCNGSGGHVTYGDDRFTVTEVSSSAVGCPPDEGRDHINAVFGGQPVTVAFEGDAAVLKSGDQTLTLRRP